VAQGIRTAKPLHWLTLSDAATRLSLAPDTLRKQIERNVRRASDGVTEASIDGIRARKFQGRWRVVLGPNWTE
jgi:hypothetical protein